MADINLIPKEYKKRKVAIGAIFSKTGGLVLGLLILSLLIYGGLLIYKNKVQKQFEGINQEINKLDLMRNKEKETNIYNTDKKINLVENLFAEHLYWSKIFTRLEQAVIPQVYFKNSKFNFVGEEVNIQLSGVAQSYTALAKQMIGLKMDPSDALASSSDPLVLKVDLTKMSLSEKGGIEFEMSVVFDKNILINKTGQTK